MAYQAALNLDVAEKLKLALRDRLVLARTGNRSELRDRSIPSGGLVELMRIRSHLEAVTSGSAQCRFVVLAGDFTDRSYELYPLIPRRSLRSVVRMWSGWAGASSSSRRREDDRLRARLKRGIDAENHAARCPRVHVSAGAQRSGATSGKERSDGNVFFRPRRVGSAARWAPDAS